MPRLVVRGLTLHFYARFNFPTQLKRFYFSKNPFARCFDKPVAYATKTAPVHSKTTPSTLKRLSVNIYGIGFLKLIYFEHN